MSNGRIGMRLGRRVGRERGRVQMGLLWVVEGCCLLGENEVVCGRSRLGEGYGWR